MLSHHDTVLLYHTCQHPINKALTHYILKQTSTKYNHKPSRTRLARMLIGGVVEWGKCRKIDQLTLTEVRIVECYRMWVLRKEIPHEYL